MYAKGNACFAYDLLILLISIALVLCAAIQCGTMFVIWMIVIAFVAATPFFLLKSSCNVTYNFSESDLKEALARNHED